MNEWTNERQFRLFILSERWRVIFLSPKKKTIFILFHFVVCIKWHQYNYELHTQILVWFRCAVLSEPLLSFISTRKSFSPVVFVSIFVFDLTKSEKIVFYFYMLIVKNPVEFLFEIVRVRACMWKHSTNLFGSFIQNFFDWFSELCLKNSNQKSR